MRYQQIVFLALVLAFVACQSGPGEKNREKASLKGEAVSRALQARVEMAITSYIKEETDQGDGFFHLQHTGRELRLKLVRMHTATLSRLGPQRHFVCVDLAEERGDVYDVDFFLQGEAGNLTVTETTVHARNGKPFYTWDLEGDKIWHKVAMEEASPKLLGVVEGTDEFAFRYFVALPEFTEKARMWVPVARSDRFQKVKIASLRAPGKQQMLEEKENGNTLLYLELGPEHSGDSLEIIYQVQRQEKEPYEEQYLTPEKYLGSSLLVPVGGRFSEIAEKVIGKKPQESRLMQARALYNYVLEQMRYIKTGEYGKGDAVYACDTRTGNCTEFHSYFISLARSAGIPARFSIGASIPSSRNEGDIEGYHCWAEFYAEGKWWPVDVSEGNKYEPLASYYFGHHPANRIELSRGRDLQVEPDPHSGPLNFLVYPLLEIGGKPVPVETSFSFIRKVK